MSGGQNERARSAVVSLTCPHCGAVLKVDSERENVSCEYCEASLIVPQIAAEAPRAEREQPRESERASEPEPEPEPRKRRRRRSEPPESERPAAKQPARAPLKVEAQIAIATLIISGVILMFFAKETELTSRETSSGRNHSDSSRDSYTPSKSGGDSELDGMIARSECQSTCTNPCMKIQDTNAMLACMNACDDRCRFVGKGSGSECRGRCTKTCEGAPTDSSRSLCFSGCTKECPP